MTHYGDITKLNGYNLPAVDVITGGSPCQDLSVAGKRAGLAGERSGLFVEQIRLIKEMRQRDRDSGRTGKLIRPKYMVWENVPGAFSSNNGEDFRAVLEETAHIADENAIIPQPPNGKWTTSGAIVGNGWSIAWRVLDAQFWGVPQRRRRIALVADFGGQSAPEILFIRNGLSWDTAESGETGERTAGDAENSAGNAECITPWDCQSKRIFSPDGQCPTLQGGIGGGVNNPAICVPEIDHAIGLTNRGFVSGDVVETARAECHGALPMVCVRERGGCKGGGKGPLMQLEKSGTLGTSNDQSVFVFTQNQRNEVRDLNDVAGSLAAEPGMKQQTFVASFSGGQGAKAGGIGYAEELAPTLKAADCGSNRSPCICIQGNCIDRSDTARCNGKGWAEDVSYTLNTIDRPAVVCMATQQGGAEIMDDKCPTIAASAGMSGNNHPVVCFDARGNGEGNIVPTKTGDHNGHVSDCTAFCVGNGQADNARLTPVADTLNCMHDQQAVMIAAVDCRNSRETGETYGTLQAKENGGQSLNYMGAVRTGCSVRRLTPLECERLQGYPDGWTDIGDWEKTDKKGKVRVVKSADSLRYKALGNSIALPPWRWVLLRITAQYERPATLGSLFDGIGGFPLIWERLNGDGSCLWASEIEGFCIAVTKTRFGMTQERSKR